MGSSVHDGDGLLCDFRFNDKVLAFFFALVDLRFESCIGKLHGFTC